MFNVEFAHALQEQGHIHGVAKIEPASSVLSWFDLAESTTTSDGDRPAAGGGAAAAAAPGASLGSGKVADCFSQEVACRPGDEVFMATPRTYAWERRALA
jgi:hypothetical protein